MNREIDKLVDLSYETGYMAAMFEAGKYGHDQELDEKQREMIAHRNAIRNQLVQRVATIRLILVGLLQVMPKDMFICGDARGAISYLSGLSETIERR
jgi:hypothetical protein